MTRVRAGYGLKLIQRPQKVEASLWRRFRFSNDQKCREKLFNRYRMMAVKLAHKQYHRRPPYGLEIPDFEQFAYAGLLEAIDKFDPLRNIPFSAYARYRILGSITDGLAHSSEGGAQYSHRRRVETDRLRSLNVDPNTEDALEQISNLVVGLALGFILEDTGVFQSPTGADPRPSAYESLSWREMQLRLKAEIENLPTTHKTVIRQHYINGVAFIQIAKLLNLSKGRISQIHKAAVERLRQRLGAS